MLLGKIEGRRTREQQKMRWLDGTNDGHALGQTLGDDEVWISLMCYSPWGHKESNNLATEQEQPRLLMNSREFNSV